MEETVLKKIYFTYGTNTREGFKTCHPDDAGILNDESVDEIAGEFVLEKAPSLVTFIEYCYEALKPGCKAIFSAPHYASVPAWANPLTVRGMSEATLNFASKDWREQTKFTEVDTDCDFTVEASFAIERSAAQRGDEARNFMLQRYNNVTQSILFTLTKKVKEV